MPSSSRLRGSGTGRKSGAEQRGRRGARVCGARHGIGIAPEKKEIIFELSLSGRVHGAEVRGTVLACHFGAAGNSHGGESGGERTPARKPVPFTVSLGSVSGARKNAGPATSSSKGHRSGWLTTIRRTGDYRGAVAELGMRPEGRKTRASPALIQARAEGGIPSGSC